MFKIAYGAGHNIANVNGIPKSLNPNNTGEWELNDRIARYFAQAAKSYPVELLRVDDPAGLEPVSLAQRCREANDWGADFFLSIHHNAGINGGKGGGLVAFCYKAGTTAEQYQKAIYNACIAAGGLKGDRSDPTPEKGFYVLVNTKAPAVLMEYGFMDSTTDVPVILTEEYAKKMAYATMEGIAQAAGLEKAEGTQQAEPEKEGKTVDIQLNVLKKGSTGETVKALQRMLYAMGYDLGSSKVDGSFGSKTDAAVKAYQKANGLTADGICGSKTWKKLLGVTG